MVCLLNAIPPSHSLEARMVGKTVVLVALCYACVSGLPGTSAAQGTIVNTYPRTIQRASSPPLADTTEARLRGEYRSRGMSPVEIQNSINRDVASRRPKAWTSLAGELEAAKFWGTDQVTLLPGASLSPGGKETALYAELAAALSG